MLKSTGWKLAGTAAALILVYMLLCRLAGFQLFGGTLVSVAGGWGLLIVQVLLFGLASRHLIRQQTETKASLSLIDLENLAILARTVRKTNPKVFKKQMRDLDTQIVRMETKAEQLDEALKSYFGASRISYAKFAATINGGLNVFCENTKRILSRIDIFDADGYEALFKKHLEYTDAIGPYQSSFQQIDADLEVNEQILQRFDRLQEEIRHLHTGQSDLDGLPAMQELSELIDQTKRYRQAGQ